MTDIRPVKPPYLSGISLSEIFWMEYKMDGRAKYVITSDMLRTKYYLYTVDRDGKCTKTNHKADEPNKLYSYMK